MKFLVTADTHFTEKSRDAYRFELLPWLAKQAEKHGVRDIYILGDLADRKDRHSSVLVNRIVEELTEMGSIHILMGNHDYVDPTSPFFEFLKHTKNVNFVTYPQFHDGLIPIMLIPHSTQEEFDKACEDVVPECGVFIHQCVTGAVSDTGKQLTGISTKALEARKPRWVWAGDIHVPQVVGCVDYIGSPYMTRFGQEYKPRVGLLDVATGAVKNLYFPAPKKLILNIKNPDEIRDLVEEGDHVKVTLELPREEAADWIKHKSKIQHICGVLNLEVYGTSLKVPDGEKQDEAVSVRTDQDVFESFCRIEDLTPDVKQAGKTIMESKGV